MLIPLASRSVRITYPLEKVPGSQRTNVPQSTAAVGRTRGKGVQATTRSSLMVLLRTEDSLLSDAMYSSGLCPSTGINFEDAIIISEELVKKDTYTSIHIEDFDVEIRETKLGREEFTRDIPNVSRKDALRNLDENGIVQVGTYVKPGDILVGKVSREKSKTELTPEEKLSARDLWSRRRGRQERFLGSSLRYRRHRDRHAASSVATNEPL